MLPDAIFFDDPPTDNLGKGPRCGRTTRDARSMVVLAILLFAGAGVGQDASQTAVRDTSLAPSAAPVVTLDAMVITADRLENRLANSTASISVMPEKELRSLPLSKNSEVLRLLPGFFNTDKDGLGRDATVSTRGFYGGGEAEYLIVLVNGRPINDLETGLVDWNLVPLSQLQKVEVMRGGASPLYGDAALGGVVNLITAGGAAQSALFVDGGGFGSLNAGLRSGGKWRNAPYQLFGSHETSRGFRDHSGWHSSALSGEVLLPQSGSSTARVSTYHQWMTGDDAGPLTDEEMAVDRTHSSPYYRYDQKDERRHQVHLDVSRVLSPSASVQAGLSYHFRDGQATRTFANPTPIIDPQTFAVTGLYDTTLYGDTKARDLQTNQVSLNLQYLVVGRWGSMGNRLVVGVDGDLGHLRNRYFEFFNGFENDYRAAGASRGALVADGKARRLKYAVYVSDELRLFSPLTLTLGARLDGLRDRYDGRLPDTTITADHRAFSPKLGLNIRYAGGSAFSGNLYVTLTRSFKAATLDQLSDQRPVTAGFFIPTGPGSFAFLSQSLSPFSNAQLNPQKATNAELGVYQRLGFSEKIHGELMVSVYRTEVKDEIDFDLTSLRYQNLHRSRHQGLEGGLRLYWPSRMTTFVNYTWSGVKFTSGENDGKALKAIPGQAINFGAMYESATGLGAGLTWSVVRDTYLDDANIRRLPNYQVGNARLAYRRDAVTLFLDVDNLLDKKFSTTGYVVFGRAYFYPAAGRRFRGGLSLTF